MLEAILVPGRRGAKGGKWDNCNNIINKIYFKKIKDFSENKTVELIMKCGMAFLYHI